MRRHGLLRSSGLQSHPLRAAIRPKGFPRTYALVRAAVSSWPLRPNSCIAQPAMNRLLHAAALGVSLAWTVRAQSVRPKAFSSLSIRAGATWFSVDSRLSRYYAPATGFVVEASTPFSFGELGLTGERATFSSVGGGNPDFHGTLALLAWRYPQRLFGPLTASLGANTGAMQFSFQDSLVNAGLRKERELVMGASGALEAHVVSRVSVFVMGEYSHVWLHVPVHLARLSAGMTYTAPSPAWLRNFLE